MSFAQNDLQEISLMRHSLSCLSEASFSEASLIHFQGSTAPRRGLLSDETESRLDLESPPLPNPIPVSVPLSSSLHLNKKEMASRAILNYTSILIIFMSVKLYRIWRYFDQSIQVFSESTKGHMVQFSKWLNDFFTLLTRFFHLLTLLSLDFSLMFLNLVTEAINRMIESLETAIQSQIASLTRLGRCLFQGAAATLFDSLSASISSTLTLPRWTNLSSHLSELRGNWIAHPPPFFQLQPPFQWPTGSSIEAEERLVQIKAYSSRLCLIFFMILSAFLVCLNLFYFWKSMRRDSIRQGLLTTLTPDRSSVSDLISIVTESDASEQPHRASMEMFIERVEHPTRFKLLRMISFIFRSSDSKAKWQRFLVYIYHPPSWFCMIYGLLGLLSVLLERHVFQSVGNVLLGIYQKSLRALEQDGLTTLGLVFDTVSNYSSLAQTEVLKALQAGLELSQMSLLPLQSLLSQLEHKMTTATLTMPSSSIGHGLDSFLSFSSSMMCDQIFKFDFLAYFRSLQSFLEKLSLLGPLSIDFKTQELFGQLIARLEEQSSKLRNESATFLWLLFQDYKNEEMIFYICVLTYGSLIIFQGWMFIFCCRGKSKSKSQP